MSRDRVIRSERVSAILPTLKTCGHHKKSFSSKSANAEGLEGPKDVPEVGTGVSTVSSPPESESVDSDNSEWRSSSRTEAERSPAETDGASSPFGAASGKQPGERRKLSGADDGPDHGPSAGEGGSRNG